MNHGLVFRCLASGCLAAYVGFGRACADAAGSPNIILILTDDQGWSQVSGRMDPRVPESASAYLETPNMDRIAKEGVRFTSGYAPAPLCTPTRRSILCGTSAARSGTEFPSETGWIPHQRLTIPFALKAANPGYRCAHFGKWGGRHMVSTPEECGYDASSGVTDNPEGGMPETLGHDNHEAAPPHFIDNEDPKRTFSVSDDSIAFIREQVAAGRPFYVQSSYYATHLSIVCKDGTLKKYAAKGVPDRGYSQAFAAMLEDLDGGIGRILDVLDELGIADNTYVFFMSDNGGRADVPGGDPQRPALNDPLTGSKQTLFEGGVRVPFMVRGPGIPAGSVCRTPVCGYDLLPTFQRLAGGTDPLPDYIDGGSIHSLLLDPEAGVVSRPGRALFFHRPRRQVSAVRDGDYKLIVNWSAMGSVRSREMYHVGVDPREAGRDISAEDPERGAALQDMLLGYLEQIGAYSPPRAAELTPTGRGEVIYRNDFSGLKGGDPGLGASGSGSGHTRVAAELNGAGQMVSTSASPGSGLRVRLGEDPLNAPTVRLAAALRATSEGRWIGIGFQGEDVQKLNEPSANSGPWLLISDRSVRVKGGTAIRGTDTLFRDTHVPGDRLTLDMAYHTQTRTLDLSINGYAVTNAMSLRHETPEGARADPVIRYLQIQIWNEPGDPASIDEVFVETLPPDASLPPEPRKRAGGRKNREETP